MLLVVRHKFTGLFGRVFVADYNAGSPFISPDN